VRGGTVEGAFNGIWSVSPIFGRAVLDADCSKVAVKRLWTVGAKLIFAKLKRFLRKAAPRTVDPV
jgi:hypothetical protein